MTARNAASMTKTTRTGRKRDPVSRGLPGRGASASSMSPARLPRSGGGLKLDLDDVGEVRRAHAVDAGTRQGRGSLRERLDERHALRGFVLHVDYGPSPAVGERHYLAHELHALQLLEEECGGLGVRCHFFERVSWVRRCFRERRPDY